MSFLLLNREIATYYHSEPQIINKFLIRKVAIAVLLLIINEKKFKLSAAGLIEKDGECVIHFFFWRGNNFSDSTELIFLLPYHAECQAVAFLWLYHKNEPI